MDDAGGMDILEAALRGANELAAHPTGTEGGKGRGAYEDLVEEVLDELLLQGAAGQEAVEVCSEEFCDKVDVFERGDEDVGEGDDVLVLDVLEQLELAVRPLRQHGSA